MVQSAFAGAFLRTRAHACAVYRQPENRDNVIDDDIERRMVTDRVHSCASPPPRLSYVTERRLRSILAPMPTVGCHLWI